MIRPMVIADVDAVLAIEREVQPYQWTRGNFTDALNSAYLCSVDSVEIVEGHPEQGIEILSYAILMPVVDEAELLTIGVAAGQQRKGLGRKILGYMLDEARERDMRCVFLEVRASNMGAIALYQRAGFIRVGTRRGYYKNGDNVEDALTMACELKVGSNG